MEEEILSMRVIEDIEDMLEFDQVPLGQGTFAAVFKAVLKESDEVVAVKQVSVPLLERQNVMREVVNLEKIVGDHIISYQQHFQYSKFIQWFILNGSHGERLLTDNTLNVIMELCQSNLRAIMMKQTFSREELLSFIVQIVSAFLELSSKGLMHLDLKPENILISGGDYFKICDFGCSQSTPRSVLSHYNTNIFGTFNYLAPELSSNYQGHYTKSSADVWSLGIILYEMVYRVLPFRTGKDRCVLHQQLQDFFSNKLQIDYPNTPAAYPEIIQIVKKMLHSDPNQRISWKELKQQLISNYEVDQHSFESIQKVASSHMNILKIFLTIAVVIRQNISLSLEPFYASNSSQLKEFSNSLVHLSYIFAKRFRSLFSYKWDKLEETTSSYLNFLEQHLLEEENSLNQIALNKSWLDLSLMAKYQNCTRQQAGQITTKIQRKQREWESINTIDIFCREIEECMQIKGTLFCSGNYASFGKTLAELRIQL